MQSPQSETESPPVEPPPAIPYATDGTQFATLAEVTAVVIRLCAAITFFQFVGYLSYVTDLLSRKTILEQLVPVIATPVGQMVVGVLLWCFADPLSRFFAPPRAFAPVPAASLIDRLQRVAFATAGLIMLVGCIPDVTRTLSYFLRVGAYGTRFSDFAPLSPLTAAGQALQVLIALWMILGNKRLGLLWLKLRSPSFR